MSKQPANSTLVGRVQIGVILEEDTMATLADMIQQAVEKGLAKLSQPASTEEASRMTAKERSEHALTRGQKPPDNMGLLLTSKEAAKLMKLSDRTLWTMWNEGRMPKPFHIGSSVRFRYEELRAWVDAGCPLLTDWTFSPETTNHGKS